MVVCEIKIITLTDSQIQIFDFLEGALSHGINAFTKLTTHSLLRVK